MYIDDLLIFSKNVKALDIVKRNFFGKFDMKDLGEILYCLGMQIRWNREEKNIRLGHKRNIRLGHKRNIEYIVISFGMENFKLVNMPYITTKKLTKDKMPKD